MIMRIKKSEIEALEAAGAVVTRAEVAKKIARAALGRPEPVKTAPAPAPAPAPNSKELVAAIRALGDKLIEAARSQPQRPPSPYKFTLKRGKDGLLESAIAEPL